MSYQVEKIMLLCALNGKDFIGITFAFAVNFEIELLEISVIGNCFWPRILRANSTQATMKF